MSADNGTLFDTQAQTTKRLVPVARQCQREGLEYINPEQSTIRSIIASHLWGQGQHGATIQELAAAVAIRRKKFTKETSITQALKDLREEGFVVDSGRSREGNAGVQNTIWIHTNAPDRTPAA
jgi:hypothetical protein